MPPAIKPGEITMLLRRMAKGDKNASNVLLPLVMDELRRLARHYMRNERLGHTLQPTALINEAYMRLAGYERMDWKSRSHFIGMAATVMRQVLLDHARKKQSEKRGAGIVKEALDDNRAALSPQQSVEIIELDRALKELEKLNPRHAKVVEMRYFGGLSVEESAEALGVSAITVKRDWSVARAWLHSRLSGVSHTA
jgi:RNA polymerase sigma factor (TIGR02999 family)